MEELQTLLFINNEFVESSEKELHALQNPFDESVVTDQVHFAAPADVDRAVAGALAAFNSGLWNSFTGPQRARCLYEFANLAEKEAARLARIESLATGRPIGGLQFFEIAHMVETIRYYAGWADKIAGESFIDDDGLYKIVQYEPIGVCAGIASWNATFMYFIFKSSEKSPLGALALGPLFIKAGFPPGVVQILSGAGDTGAALASHPHISKISFTGSATVGRMVQDAATRSNLKRVTLELGGKSPAIVFPDAPMDIAIANVGSGFLANSGQICVAASRVLVHASIATSFVGKLKSLFEEAASKLGSDPLEVQTDHGPVADLQQYQRIMTYIEQGKKDASLVTGGSRKGDKGFFICPTLFLDPPEDSSIWREEIFGPVLCVKTFQTEEEAIHLANNTDYGLSSCIYTTDVTRALRLAGKLESGTVSVNTPHLPSRNTPLGGKKQSGYGRELGKHGLMSYLEAKTIHINMNVPSKL
ncbi:hypothetical protein ACET3X_008817 [Alternaria dauci]|uniref:aldehyde dehydrogenase (NAD(+)) n=1 Tax=Alternaria dauci TaxID=48095 RepID=A0ABR3U7K4_9PLEO